MTQSPRVPIIFGTATFGEKDKVGVRTSSIEECQELVDVFIKNGGKEFDVARLYGNGTSEEYLSKLNLYESELDTKAFPTTPNSFTEDNLRNQIDQSIKALGKNSKIRTLFLHWPDRSVSIEETLKAIDVLHKEGKFQQLGLSNYPSFEVAEFCSLAKTLGLLQPTSYQGAYNAITREMEAELIPCLRYWNIRLIIYNPLAGGLLTGKIQRDLNNIEPGSRFDLSEANKDKFFANVFRQKFIREKNFDAIDLIKPVVEKYKITLAEASFRWLQNHSSLTEKDAIAIGASSVQQLQANLDSNTKGPLPQEIVDAFEQAYLIAKPMNPVYWR